MTESKLIPLSQAPEIVEELTGDRPSLKTVYRWANAGIGGVRLKTAWATKLRTSKEWIIEFMDAVAEAKANPTVRLATPTKAARAQQKRHEEDLSYILSA